MRIRTMAATAFVAFGILSAAALPQLAAPPTITAVEVFDHSIGDPAITRVASVVSHVTGLTPAPQTAGDSASAGDIKCIVKFFDPERLASWNPLVFFQAKIICNGNVGTSELLVEQNDQIVVAGSITNNQTGVTQHSLTARLNDEQQETFCLAIARQSGPDGTKAGGAYEIVAQECFPGLEEPDEEPEDRTTLEVIKQLEPSSDSGLFNLQIDGVTAASDVGDGDSTGPVSVSAGPHTVGETAGTGTSLSDYTTVIGGDCAPDGSVSLATGDNKTCTITNTRKQVEQATLTVTKTLVPDDDPGLFNLQIDGATHAANVGNSGTTGAVAVTPGNHTVGETAGTNTVLSSYTVTIGGDCAADGSVTVAAGDNKTCTITNTRKQVEQATLTVTKTLVPDDDPGLFNLQIDGATHAANVGNSGTTGAVAVTPGNHTVGETAGTNTVLSSYTVTIGGDCNSSGNVTLAAGENKTCTITNTRKTPVLGKTQGFWGNRNGHAVLDPGNDGNVDMPVTIGGGSRSFTATTIAQSDKILSNDACQSGTPVIFFPCTLSADLMLNTLEILASQTLALSYNIVNISGYTGQTIDVLDCSSFLTPALTSAPVNLSPSSTVNDVRTAANDRIANSSAGGTTTQAQAGGLNSLLGCLNRES